MGATATVMEYDGYVAAIERESAALLTTLRVGPLDALVPSCPGWALADLAAHVGAVTGFWTHILCEGIGRPKTLFPDVPAGPALADWCEELIANLLAVLRETPPSTTVWTWVDSDQTARFVGRRLAHELAVHRYDAQLARDTPQPIDAALAVDGIEEIFVMMGATPRSGQATGETLHLHATDGAGEWLVTLHPDRFDVAREHAKGDLALRGAVSDLELLLYQRPPIGDVEQLGAPAILAAWYREFTFT